MRIKARLFASLRAYTPGSKPGATLEVELPPGARVRDLVAHFHIPAEVVKLAFVNGLSQEMDTELRENDEVGIFPPVGGG